MGTVKGWLLHTTNREPCQAAWLPCPAAVPPATSPLASRCLQRCCVAHGIGVPLFVCSGAQAAMAKKQEKVAAAAEPAVEPEVRHCHKLQRGCDPCLLALCHSACTPHATQPPPVGVGFQKGSLLLAPGSSRREPRIACITSAIWRLLFTAAATATACPRSRAG